MGELRGLLIGLVLFSGIVIGVTAFYGEMATNYGVTTTADFGYLNRSIETANLIAKMQNRTAQTLSSSEVSAYNPLSAIEAVKIGGESLGIITAMIGDVTSPDKSGVSLPIPSWVSAMLIGVISIFVVFVVLKAWLKVDS